MPTRKLLIVYFLILILLNVVSCSPHKIKESNLSSDNNLQTIEDNCTNTDTPYFYDRDNDGKSGFCDKNIFLRAGAFDPVNEEEKYVPNITVKEATGYYFIQFEEWFDYAELEDFLNDISAKKVDSFEGEVIIVKTDSDLIKTDSYNFVRASGIYHPANRVNPEVVVGRFLYENGSVIEQDNNLTLEIYLYDGVDDAVSAIKKLGGIILKKSGNILLVKINQLKFGEIIQLPDIDFVNPSPIIRYADEYSGIITGVKDVQEEFSLKGKGEVITIADSGLDSGGVYSMHPDLQGRIVKILDVGTNTKKDLTGHGTHVAATAVGSGRISNGILKGSAPEAKIIFQATGNELPEKYYSKDYLKKQKGGTKPQPLFCFGKPEATTDKKIIKKSYSAMGLAGIPLNYVELFNQSKIQSNSWGSCQGEYTPRVGYIDKFLYQNQDLVVLFSAGNGAEFIFIGEDGEVMQRGGDSLGNTARAKNAITVGATETSRKIKNQSSDKVAGYSSKGDKNSGRIKPDIVAPGSFILSARSSACIDGVVIKTFNEKEVQESKVNFTHENCIGKGLPSSFGLSFNDKFYMFNSGTSMSTPHVAGLVAVIREYYRIYKNYTNPSSALIKATLINGARDLPDQEDVSKYNLEKEVSCKGYPNMCEGWGRVNISESLFPGKDSNKLWFVDISQGIIKTGDAKNFSINFDTSKPVKITLAWTDPPPELLQNDIDISIESPSGKFYFGNTFTQDGKNSIENPIAKNARLNNNNVERIIIQRPEKGEYKISVKGKKVKIPGNQPFAIVASSFVNKG